MFRKKNQSTRTLRTNLSDKDGQRAMNTYEFLLDYFKGLKKQEQTYSRLHIGNPLNLVSKVMVNPVKAFFNLYKKISREKTKDFDQYQKQAINRLSIMMNIEEFEKYNGYGDNSEGQTFRNFIENYLKKTKPPAGKPNNNFTVDEVIKKYKEYIKLETKEEKDNSEYMMLDEKLRTDFEQDIINSLPLFSSTGQPIKPTNSNNVIRKIGISINNLRTPDQKDKIVEEASKIPTIINAFMKSKNYHPITSQKHSEFITWVKTNKLLLPEYYHNPNLIGVRERREIDRITNEIIYANSVFRPILPPRYELTENSSLMNLNNRASVVLRKASTLSRKHRNVNPTTSNEENENNKNPGKQTSLIKAKSMKKRAKNSSSMRSSTNSAYVSGSRLVPLSKVRNGNGNRNGNNDF